MVAEMVDTGGSDEVCELLCVPQCLHGCLGSNGERQAVQRDGGRGRESSEATRPAIVEVPIGDVLPHLNDRQLVEEQWNQSRAICASGGGE